MAGYDDKAFDAMQNKTQTTGALYTESFYNTNAGKDEQSTLDRKANTYLRRMWKDDKDAGMFEKLSFDEYMGVLSSSFFEERVNFPTKTDPGYFEELGIFFGENYEGDFDQFKDSAAKYDPSDNK